MQGQVEEHIYLLFLTLEVAIIFSLKKTKQNRRIQNTPTNQNWADKPFLALAKSFNN